MQKVVLTIVGAVALLVIAWLSLAVGTRVLYFSAPDVAFEHTVISPRPSSVQVLEHGGSMLGGYWAFHFTGSSNDVDAIMKELELKEFVAEDTNRLIQIRAETLRMTADLNLCLPSSGDVRFYEFDQDKVSPRGGWSVVCQSNGLEIVYMMIALGRSRMNSHSVFPSGR